MCCRDRACKRLVGVGYGKERRGGRAGWLGGEWREPGEGVWEALCLVCILEYVALLKFSSGLSRGDAARGGGRAEIRSLTEKYFV